MSRLLAAVLVACGLLLTWWAVAVRHRTAEQVVGWFIVFGGAYVIGTLTYRRIRARLAHRG